LKYLLEIINNQWWKLVFSQSDVTNKAKEQTIQKNKI